MGLLLISVTYFTILCLIFFIKRKAQCSVVSGDHCLQFPDQPGVIDVTSLR